MNRAERRRQRHEDEKRIVRGFDPRQPAGGQIVALMRALDQKLALGIQRLSVGPLMEFVYSNMSSGARLVGDVPIACGRGCSHCCHSWVDASPAEVLFAAKSISPDRRAAVLQAVERMCGETAGRGFEERSAMVTRCPLLESNICRAYESRPIVCRSAVSADAEACRRSYLALSGGSIPVPTVWRALGQGYAAALEGAMLHAGLVPAAREWNESLLIALRDSAAEARWLSGEDVFRSAPRASPASTFAAPAWAAIYREAFGAPPPAPTAD
jgi:hypothetical protein